MRAVVTAKRRALFAALRVETAAAAIVRHVEREQRRAWLVSDEQAAAAANDAMVTALAVLVTAERASDAARAAFDKVNR